MAQMTRAQYDEIVRAKGPQWADNWRAQNGVQVEGMQPVENDTYDEELPPVALQGALPSANSQAAPSMLSVQDMYTQQQQLGTDLNKYWEQMQRDRKAQYEQATAELEKRRYGPSRAEQLFQLAAAIGTPTIDRSFGSIMANVVPTFASIEKAKRTAEEERSAAARALREKYLGEDQQLGFNILQQRQKNISALTPLAVAQERARAEASKPPRTVGTQVVGGKVVAIREDKSGNLTTVPLGAAPSSLKPIPGQTSGGQPVFMGPNGPVDATGNPVSQFDVKAKPVSATEQREIFETEDIINSGLGTVKTLEQAIALNPQAYEGSLTGWRKTLGQLVSSDDPQYVATENFDNLVMTGALQSLKATFGANPTEGERKILLDLQAISTKPRAVRDEILRRALAAAKTKTARETKRLQGLKGGEYSTRGGSTVGETRVIRYDKNGKRI